MEELNVPHYRLRCSVALYIDKALLVQEPRSPKADTRRPDPRTPAARMEVHGEANVQRSRGVL
jgi:hypothetical protein